MAKVFVNKMCEALPNNFTITDLDAYHQLRRFLENRFAAGTKCKVRTRQEWFLRTPGSQRHVVFTEITLPLCNMLRDLDSALVNFLIMNDFTVFMDDGKSITFVREVNETTPNVAQVNHAGAEPQFEKAQDLVDWVTTLPPHLAKNVFTEALEKHLNEALEGKANAKHVIAFNSRYTG